MADDWDDDSADDSALKLNLTAARMFVNLDRAATKSSTSPVAPAATEDEASWDVVSKPISAKPTSTASSSKPVDEQEPDIIILVDLTVLSNGAIHNKFDKYSVNDPDAKKDLCNTINTQYATYANDSKLICEGTVRHCSERVTSTLPSLSSPCLLHCRSCCSP